MGGGGGFWSLEFELLLCIQVNQVLPFTTIVINVHDLGPVEGICDGLCKQSKKTVDFEILVDCMRPRRNYFQVELFIPCERVWWWTSGKKKNRTSCVGFAFLTLCLEKKGKKGTDWNYLCFLPWHIFFSFSLHPTTWMWILVLMTCISSMKNVVATSLAHQALCSIMSCLLWEQWFSEID